MRSSAEGPDARSADPVLHRGEEESAPPRERAAVQRPAFTVALDLQRATDVDRRADWERIARESAICRNTPSLVGTLQRAGLGVTQSLRAELARMTPEREEELGRAIHESLQRGPSPLRIIEDPAVTTYLRAVLDPIDQLRDNRDVPLKLFYIDMPGPNAFASLGGYIYVTRDLLSSGDLVSNEATLASVLAHEVGHLDLRHVAHVFDVLDSLDVDLGDPQTQLQAGTFLLMLHRSYSRELEAEADEYAFGRLNTIGYSNLQVERAWYELLDPSDREQSLGSGAIIDMLGGEVERALTSHPTPRERMCNIRRLLRENPPAQDVAYRGTRNLPDRVSASSRVD